MNLELYVAFCLATTVMILMPGPSVMLSVAHSLAYGWKRALVTVSGAVAGLAVQLAVAIAGLTSLMVLAADLFEIIRWLGVGYLLWLGIQQWRAHPELPGEMAATSARSLFVQGLVVTLLNPKSLIFLAAFFPQFVDPATPPVLQFSVLGITFLTIAFVFTGGWIVAAARARAWFQTRRQILWRNRITGSLMIGAGVGLAAARRA